jgi:hypothetical protein
VRRTSSASEIAPSFANSLTAAASPDGSPPVASRAATILPLVFREIGANWVIGRWESGVLRGTGRRRWLATSKSWPKSPRSRRRAGTSVVEPACPPSRPTGPTPAGTTQGELTATARRSFARRALSTPSGRKHLAPLRATARTSPGRGATIAAVRQAHMWRGDASRSRRRSAR